MNIILHSGEEIVFDTSKVVEALSKALFRIAEIVEELKDSIERAIFTTLHSMAHWLMNCFYSVRKKVKHSFSYNPMLTVIVTTLVSLCVKILSRVSALIALETRTTYLLRTQDRGSSDSDGKFVFSNIAA